MVGFARPTCQPEIVFAVLRQWPRCSLYCSPLAAHQSCLTSAEAGSLNCVCYMWWDEFPCIALAGDPDLELLQNTALRTIERILRLDSVACQESALHGLGHRRKHESRVANVIEKYLAANPRLDPRIVTYAKSAACGCVL